MDWQYSNPLSNAIIAAKPELNNSNDFYKSYDPLVARYQPTLKHNSYRSTSAINFLDDIDDFSLSLNEEQFLSSRNLNRSRQYYDSKEYIPTYFENKETSRYYNNNNNNNNNNHNNESNNYENQNNDDSSDTSSIENTKNNDNSNKNTTKNSIPQNSKSKTNTKLNPKNTKSEVINKNNNNNKQVQTQRSDKNLTLFHQPLPFKSSNSPQVHNYQSPPQKIPSFDSFYSNYTPPGGQNYDSPITYNHNNHQQRQIQYQHRLQQEQYQKYNNNTNQLIGPAPYGTNYTSYSTEFKNENDYYTQHPHQSFKKQYSETSIVSTNADPLSSTNQSPISINRSGQKQNNVKFNLKDKKYVSTDLNKKLANNDDSGEL
jgi:hypothetical protein